MSRKRKAADGVDVAGDTEPLPQKGDRVSVCFLDDFGEEVWWNGTVQSKTFLGWKCPIAAVFSILYDARGSTAKETGSLHVTRDASPW